tara:strand:- start:2109 stop:2603 length:495 start_codon:yes stop_codon:yes gene_type:complete
MNTLDIFISHRIIDFLNVPCCKSNDVNNIKCVNRELKAMLQEYKKFKKHRLIKIKTNNSKIIWKHVKLCLTCNRINETDIQEILSIRDKFSRVQVHPNTLFNKINLKKYDYRNNTLSPSSSINIHRDTQQELETFIVKLKRVISNVVISKNYCCEGKGVEIDLS